LRSAIREGVKVRLAYAGSSAGSSERVVEPLALFFWGEHWTLAAWCTRRQGFRMFRLDRMREVARMPGTVCDHTLDQYLTQESPPGR
jgi:predicted DNA-binding transcriptional regulator YafY